MRDVLYSLLEVESGKVVIEKLYVADTFWKQAVGLLGKRGLNENEGLWIEPCNGVHTFGMRFAIDLLFLDKSGLAVHRAFHVKPWRICGPIWGTRIVVEMPAGALVQVNIQPGRHYVKIPREQESKF
ncbi:hypothetical protein CWRG_01021 [Chthonomonas calidirosea]|uniref:DUF192 domain-containing protein n=1 Tax=Chthonomonas calidirosea TaxID=454171 RepID=UPI0006DD4FA0|nr:DUF192 domain-containing protein [Chthonomonas calidirosea]CEK15024.1 hypothetical protein CWRG_01021 [Chthonomonas calidirosea]